MQPYCLDILCAFAHSGKPLQDRQLVLTNPIRKKSFETA